MTVVVVYFFFFGKLLILLRCIFVYMCICSFYLNELFSRIEYPNFLFSVLIFVTLITFMGSKLFG